MSDIKSDIAETMISAAHELSLYIAEANQELRMKVHSQTESEPDCHDAQTCYELAQDAKRVIAMQARIVELEKAISGILNSPHTKLTKGTLLEVSEVDIDAAIKALEK